MTGTKQRRAWWLGWGAAGLVVLTGLAGASAVHFRAQDAARQAALAEVGQSRPGGSAVHALGRLEPAGTVRQIAPRSGSEGARVERLLVQEGDDVPAGGMLAILDSWGTRQASLAEAESRLELARARLQQVQAGAKAGDIAAQQYAVELQVEQLKVVERDLKRARELHAKNAVSQEDLDNRQWLFDRVRLEHRRALEQLNAIRDIREVDIRVAEREVATAAAAVQRAQVELESAQVTAPAAGRVLKIHAQEGERLSDQGLLELGDVQRMEAVAEVFEGDLIHLRPGLSATVKVDCLPEPLAGEISQLGHRVARKVVLTNDPVSDTDARVVEVRLRLAAADIPRVARLANARVEVTIAIPEAAAESAPR